MGAPATRPATIAGRRIIHQNLSHLIGEQVPRVGADPEFPEDGQVIVEIGWLALDEISERDRAILWGGGLLGIPAFLEEVTRWGDEVSYPGAKEHDAAAGTPL